MSRYRLKTKKIALVSVLSASAIASNYLLIGVPNVKFMDLIVFTAGAIMGSKMGVATGTLVWLVYGTINPYGFSFPILVATILGESIYGIAGGMYGKKSKIEVWGFDFSAAILGFLLTCGYDLFTNAVFAFTFGISFSLSLVAGIPFMLSHVLSNTLIFGVGFKPLINSIKKLLVD